MRVVPISAPLGANILDVDVTRLGDNQWQEINHLFLQYRVLAFPNQTLTPEQHMAFASRWGELVQHPYASMNDYPGLIELKNTGKTRDVNQHWHSDMTYNPAPPKLTMLYALEAPEIGGDTAFANQIIAYNELSEGLKSTLANLTERAIRLFEATMKPVNKPCMSVALSHKDLTGGVEAKARGCLKHCLNKAQDQSIRLDIAGNRVICLCGITAR